MAAAYGSRMMHRFAPSENEIAPETFETRLANLRDAVLPKLLSVELSVNRVQTTA